MIDQRPDRSDGRRETRTRGNDAATSGTVVPRDSDFDPAIGLVLGGFLSALLWGLLISVLS